MKDELEIIGLASRRQRIATIVAAMIVGDYGDSQFWSGVVEDAITVDDEIIRQTQPPESTDERDEEDQ